jgi:hypothetical protein
MLNNKGLEVITANNVECSVQELPNKIFELCKGNLEVLDYRDNGRPYTVLDLLKSHNNWYAQNDWTCLEDALKITKIQSTISIGFRYDSDSIFKCYLKRIGDDVYDINIEILSKREGKMYQRLLELEVKLRYELSDVFHKYFDY